MADPLKDATVRVCWFCDYREYRNGPEWHIEDDNYDGWSECQVCKGFTLTLMPYRDLDSAEQDRSHWEHVFNLDGTYRYYAVELLLALLRQLKVDTRPLFELAEKLDPSGTALPERHYSQVLKHLTKLLDTVDNHDLPLVEEMWEQLRREFLMAHWIWSGFIKP